MLFGLVFLCLAYFVGSQYVALQLKGRNPKSFFSWLKCDYVGKIDPYYICARNDASPSTRDLFLRAFFHPSVSKAVTSQRSVRATRFYLNDPDLSQQQLYVGPYGKHTGELRRFSHNLFKLWERGITGKNVVVAIVDDGVDTTHPELVDNYDAQASFNFLTNEANPHTFTEFHGTKCAGLIAAKANNSACGAGAAYGVRFVALRIMASAVGQVIDLNEALAFNHAINYISIFSMSWGPVDDGKKRARPSELVSRAFEIGALTGRGGKGSIYLFASGNGGPYLDRCHADGYLQEYPVTAIGSMTSEGGFPPYAERCTAILASTLSNANRRPENKIYTTQPRNQCGRFHSGTSVSAPIAASLFALVLQVRPDLSRRDLENLVVLTAIQNDPDAIPNAAGHRYSLNFGFGLIDVHKMIEKATHSSFKHLAPLSVCRTPYFSVGSSLVAGGTIHSSIYSSGCLGTAYAVTLIEVVIVTLSINTALLSELSGHIISPSGTRVPFLEPRILDESSEGLTDWDVKVMSFYNEKAYGVWRLEVTSERPRFLELVKWGVSMYGISDERLNASRFHHETMHAICTQQNIQGNGYLERLCAHPVGVPISTRRDVDTIAFYDSSYVFGTPISNSPKISNILSCLFVIFLAIFVLYALIKFYSSLRSQPLPLEKQSLVIATNRTT